MVSATPKLPLRHLSIRVPWHDNAWNGTTCCNPIGNASCLILKRIGQTRDDSKEMATAGRPWNELEREQWPACVPERAGFMAPFEYSRIVNHPYADFSPAHEHFAPTPFRHPPHSASCLPFRWMLTESASRIVQEYDIPFSQDLEDRAHELMKRSDTQRRTAWVQDKRNQFAMLNTFFSVVEPQKTLCFFYAKQTPLSEDPRRVIVGVGRVTGLGPQIEYSYQAEGELRSVVWERNIIHSIRPDFRDGFLLPYHQLLDRAARDPSFDPSPCVAFAPEESWEEYSYGSEHVRHDTAISSLLVCAEALREAGKAGIPGDWEAPLRWIDERLNELWRMRGPCPGLGSALAAFKVQHANFLAYDLASVAGENEDPWPLVEQAFEDPSLLGMGLEKRIGKTLVQKWKALPEERRNLLKLLSRFDLTAPQALRLYDRTEREKSRIQIADGQLLENPYLLYELDRYSPDPIAIGTVDRGLFPDPAVREAHPLPEPSLVEDATDSRRVRALTVSVLERAASLGDTLQPQSRVIDGVRNLPLSPSCNVDEDLMPIAEATFDDVVMRVETSDGAPAYQLSRLSAMGERIRSTVERRGKGARHVIEADWAALLDAKLGGVANASDEAEVNARREKVAALEELAASRVSVLIGPAGTGKTTLLSVLCDHPDVRKGGVTLLAPTGKARVQLERNTGIRCQTIAQFLLPLDRYDPHTGTYRLSERAPEPAGRTVVIDEASMLTEEALAAVLDALPMKSSVDRLILVGDSRQLPPIGSGRPFVDIVARLSSDDLEGAFPRVGPSYAELTIRRRQQGQGRDDLLLAEWFSGQAPGAGADEVWDRVMSHVSARNLRFVKWEDGADLHEKLLNMIVGELGLAGRDDLAGFEQTLGGSLYGENGQVYFWPGKNGQPGAAGKVEDWQILAPVRGQAYGTVELNRVIQRHFRKQKLEWATTSGRWRKIPQPFGAESIVYGDKVINTTNQRRYKVFPEEGALKYVANGEIGIVVGQYKRQNAKYKGAPWKLEVEFSSQPGRSYDYYTGDLGDEGEVTLELAYALSIHKAQGSEFGITFLILPSPLRSLSRELLYTALTRQRDRVVILHQGDVSELKRYSSPVYSETARRLTNLFAAPTLVKVADTFLENKLIHRTRRGEAVRSKSEVIIADLLYSKGLDYSYELPLIGTNEELRYPDFTIEDAESGVKVYWEHLGMLHDPEYRARWEQKLSWYRSQGILRREEGGGAAGMLVVTRDDEKGAISSAHLERIVREVFGL